MLRTSDNAYTLAVEKLAGEGGTLFHFPLTSIKSTTSLSTIPDNTNTLFKIIIKNNINILVKEIICNKTDLLILIDNLNEILLERLNETYVFFNCKNSDLISNIFKIELGDNNLIFDTNSYIDMNKITMTIFDYIDERMIKILQLNITDCIDILIDEISTTINQ